MRSRILAATALIAITTPTAACDPSDDGSASNPQSHNSTGAQSQRHAAAKLGLTLPPWKTSAPGAYEGKIFMPKDAQVVETLSGGNDGATADSATTFKPADIGKGMQVRFACKDVKTEDTVNYVVFKVGTLDASGGFDSYEDAPSPKTSDSFFFNWDWLSTTFKPGVKGFITVYGNCAYEIRVLRFSQQPLPNFLG